MDNKTNKLANFLLGAGVIAVIVVGMWGLGRVLPQIPNSLSKVSAAAVTLFQTFIPKESLELSSSAREILTGESFALSWSHRTKDTRGYYSLTYPCTENLALTIGEKSQNLVCNDYFLIQKGQIESLPIKVNFNGLGETELLITLGFRETSVEEDRITASVSIKVYGKNIIPKLTPVDSGASVSMQTPETKTVSAGVNATSSKYQAGEKTESLHPIGTETQASPIGKIDLESKIIEAGIIDRITNEFTATTTLKSSDRIAVRFEVKNVGSKESGSWFFNAVLPTYPMHIFSSEGQQSLMPGDKIEYTLGFDSIVPGENVRFVVNADPTSSIPELNEKNNIAEIYIYAE